MSKKRSDSSRGIEPPEIDDLKLIHGIGPAVERRLHGIGIYTYAQLAALSPADIAAALIGLSGLTAERIIKQDWIGQARELASISMPEEAQEELAFIIELEAPSENAHHAPLLETFPSTASQIELAALGTEDTETPIQVIAEPELPGPDDEVIKLASSVSTSPGAEEITIAPVVAMTGILHLRQIKMVVAGTQTPQNALPYGQPLDVYLTLDLSDVKTSVDTPFSYRASIYSKRLEGHSRQALAETSGIITSTPKVTVPIEEIALPKGSYRLQAVVILNPVTTESTLQTGLAASKESDMLLIF